MKVEHPVINDSENLAFHMFDEMFQTVSAVKGEYNDLVMFNMQLGLEIALCSDEMSGMLSTCTYVQLINRDQYLPGIWLSKSREFGRTEKIQGLLETFDARYSKQFPDILVNKNDVLLFVIFGVVHISKPTLLYLVFGPGPYLAYDILAKLPGNAMDIFRQRRTYTAEN
ncbi:hypothetical protein KY285_023536 [Solanum tuberosum]|nr:hypothetical protein KY289_023869 [Solanum tuberosum]KAH0675735.1 hypothetical protein KY285_023536 [Solanum tuberosum]